MFSSPLWAHPFRPFFLATGVFAAVPVVLWVAYLLAGWTMPLAFGPMYWHSHEMIFGWVPTAMAGFLLTAVTNWTGVAPLKGGRLFALLTLWFAGRVLLFFSGVLVVSGLPFLLIVLVDVSFLVVMAIYMLTVLLKYKNYRNLKLVGVLSLMAVGNALMLIGMESNNLPLMIAGRNLGLDVITLVMIIVGGRITPAFTKNWLKKHNRDASPVQEFSPLANLAMAGAMLLVIADLLLEETYLFAGVLLIAALINGLRLFFWRGWIVRDEPLLWVLHLGYLWVIVALCLRAAGILFLVIPDSLWQHTLGLGAMGTLIFGVMTRVALGHTGRVIQLPRFGVLIYYAVTIAVIIRLATLLNVLDFTLGLALTTALWLIAAVLFVIMYFPVLSSPRVDGKPG